MTRVSSENFPRCSVPGVIAQCTFTYVRNSPRCQSSWTFPVEAHVHLLGEGGVSDWILQLSYQGRQYCPDVWSKLSE